MGDLFINRDLKEEIIKQSSYFPVVTITVQDNPVKQRCVSRCSLIIIMLTWKILQKQKL